MAVLILTGCGSQNNSSKNNSTSKKQTTTAVNKKSPKKTAKKDAVLWDGTKDNQLKTFIDQWAPTMKQSYVKYDGSKSLKTSTGTSYPDDLSKVSVENTNASIGWDKTGKGNYDYDVVAIYNYNGTVPPLPNHITYFFAFHNGQPIVLVDQSRDGTPNLTETANTKLKSGFADIVAGKKVTIEQNKQASSDSNNAAEQITDPKMIGAMVYKVAVPGLDLANVGEYFGVYIYNGTYWAGTGTSVSDIGFKIKGNMVTYYTSKYNEETDKDDLIPHDISLSELEKETYSTNEQKQVVQDVVGKMPQVTDMTGE